MVNGELDDSLDSKLDGNAEQVSASFMRTHQRPWLSPAIAARRENQVDELSTLVAFASRSNREYREYR
jgi:hypothetical protein